MEPKPTVLLVEDDQNLGYLMVDFLTSKGFKVTLCRDGVSGWKTFTAYPFSFAILDLMLPEMDGFTLAKKIKETQPELPVIFVTARSMKEDKIKGFSLGIDDYITKPFDEDELFCRIQAILNRVGQRNPGKNGKTTIGRYTYEYNNQCICLDRECRRLTRRENEVLNLLNRNIGQIVRREVILKAVWGSSDYFSGRSLDVYISKLRKYLQEDPSVGIENISKVGFMLRVGPSN